MKRRPDSFITHIPQSCLISKVALGVQPANTLVSQYSMYGHIAKMAEAEKKGIEKAGGTVDMFQ